MMVVQWGVLSLCRRACLTDTSYTGCHCSLWTDWCSGWLDAGWEICGTTTCMLHHCLSCPPGHVSLCVLMCFYLPCEKDKLGVITNEQKMYEWCGHFLIPPLYCLNLYSLFHYCYLSVIPDPCTEVFLPVYLVLKQQGQRVSPPITYTGSARLT